jgi:hypothetical protein
MSEKRAVIDDRKPEKAVVKTEDGKFTITFDRPPLLLFVSSDGNGTFDQLFINGKESVDHYSITIDSQVGEPTVYHVSKYAFVTEESTDEAV